MLSVKYSHSQYQSFVKDFFTQFFINTNQNITLFTRKDLILKLWIADLSGIVSVIKSQYSHSHLGTPPKDPVALFRCLILMTLTGETSISKWINTLKSEPFFAILSGFLPACYSSSYASDIYADTLPGVGTLYDFMDRLIRKDRILYKSKLRKFKRKPKKKKKLKKNQKLNTSKKGVVDRLVHRVIKYDNHKLPDTLESTLNLILKEIFVKPSFDMNILGNPNKFNVAADGTCMPSHASHYGKKVCNCKLKSNEHCDCPRLFSDPTAQWGWDSYKEQYFYGHTFHCFTASNSFYSLPIHIKGVSGERHDSVTGIYHLKEMVDLYPNINFYSSSFDAAYDANSFYLLNMHFDINPVINLNKRAAKPLSDKDIIEYDDNGIPHCKIHGHKLRNWGIMKKSYRRKWLFPKACYTCNDCPFLSKKTHYTKTLDNPRSFTSIIRGSDEWKHLYKRRTTTERFWDRVNNDYNAEKAMVLSKEQRIVRVFLSSFCCYIDAWLKESNLSITDIFQNL